MADLNVPQINLSKELEDTANKDFQEDLRKVTDAVNAPETADTLPKLLDSCFQKGLEKLYATDEGKNFVNNLNDQIYTLLAQGSEDTDGNTTLTYPETGEDGAALASLQKLLFPLVNKYEVTTNFDIKDAPLVTN